MSSTSRGLAVSAIYPNWTYASFLQYQLLFQGRQVPRFFAAHASGAHNYVETSCLVYAYSASNYYIGEATLGTISGKLAVLVVAVALLAALGSAQLAQKKSLTLATAKQIAAAAEAEAAANKFSMVIVIVDDGGNLMYLERMDEAQLASIQIAQGKAHTALAFKRPTKALEDAVAGGRNALITLEGNVLIEGGIPLEADGKIIGAIGVSGGTAQQDGGVAKAGVDAFVKMLAH